jgi:hypothetical protein
VAVFLLNEKEAENIAEPGESGGCEDHLNPLLGLKVALAFCELAVDRPSEQSDRVCETRKGNEERNKVQFLDLIHLVVDFSLPCYQLWSKDSAILSIFDEIINVVL